jgi:hypothetical protein
MVYSLDESDRKHREIFSRSTAVVATVRIGRPKRSRLCRSTRKHARHARDETQNRVKAEVASRRPCSTVSALQIAPDVLRSMICAFCLFLASQSSEIDWPTGSEGGWTRSDGLAFGLQVSRMAMARREATDAKVPLLAT